MLARCATAIDSVQHGYDGEVVYGFARLGGQQQQVTHAEVAVEFAASARASAGRFFVVVECEHEIRPRRTLKGSM
jgi:hypothetical protein